MTGAKTPVVLDFLVPAGNDWALRLNTTTTTTRLWRNDSGSVFPFSTSSLSMTGHSYAADQTYYYYFYDWLFTPARVGWDVRLHDLSIDGALTVRACETATLGPDLDLLFPADVDVEGWCVHRARVAAERRGRCVCRPPRPIQPCYPTENQPPWRSSSYAPADPT